MIINIIYIILILIYLISLYLVIHHYRNNIKELFTLYPKVDIFYKKNKTYYKNFYNRNSLLNVSDYGPYGYNRDGYNRDGFNKEGYDIYGYNINGFNKKGYNIYGYNSDGLNKDGYNRAGYKYNSISNRYLNKYGYDKNGYNKYGYDKYGYNKYGYNKDGINQYGFDISGVNQQLKPNVFQRKSVIYNIPSFTVIDKTTVEYNKNRIDKQLEQEKRKEYEASEYLLESNKQFKKNKCTHNLSSVYNTYGCNLYTYYNKCVECVNDHSDNFLVYEPTYCKGNDPKKCDNSNNWTPAQVLCVKDGSKSKSSNGIYTKPNNFKCINPPDAEGSGFGCYNKQFYQNKIIDNKIINLVNKMKHSYVKPVDPSTNNNNICPYQNIYGERNIRTKKPYTVLSIIYNINIPLTNTIKSDINSTFINYIKDFKTNNKNYNIGIDSYKIDIEDKYASIFITLKTNTNNFLLTTQEQFKEYFFSKSKFNDNITINNNTQLNNKKIFFI